jgi:hypothetical protein
MRPSRPLAAALALSLAAAGCAALGGGSSSRVLSTAQFDDVPVPRGFALDLSEGRSFSYTEGGSGPASIRMGRLEYAGQGVPEEVLAWYASEMPRPIHGWDTGAAAGDGRMLFLRGDERCLVSVLQEGAGLRLVVERNTGGAVVP